MMLDLNLDAEAFSQSRALLDQKNIQNLDFPGFLELYAYFCNIAADSPNNNMNRSDNVSTTLPWIPKINGCWIEVSSSILKKVRSASEPYSISAAIAGESQPTAIFLLPPQLRVLKHADEEAGNVWVKGEDLCDIMLLLGIAATDNTVDSAVNKLRNFLPGIITGKYCLQVFVISKYYYRSIIISRCHCYYFYYRKY